MAQYYYMFAEADQPSLMVQPLQSFVVQRGANPVKSMLYNHPALFSQLYQTGVIDLDDFDEDDDTISIYNPYNEDLEFEDAIGLYIERMDAVPSHWADLAWDRIRHLSGVTLHDKIASLEDSTVLVIFGPDFVPLLQNEDRPVEQLR